MAARDKDRVIDLYREFVHPNVGEATLFDGDQYRLENDSNNSTVGRLAHLIQPDSTLSAAVNLIAFADPPGLYLDGIETAGFRTPDGTDAATFWTIERGTPQHTLRASFTVPEGLGYKVGDIEFNGKMLRVGAELADRVSVRVGVIVKPAGHQPHRQACGA